MRDSEMNSVFFFFAGDSSPANVTLSDEEEVNKHKGILSLWDPKTVKQGNKGERNVSSQPKSHRLYLPVGMLLSILLCNPNKTLR